MSALVWFRRDIRLDDHHALFKACKEHQDVQLVFVFDTNILSKLKNKNDRRITFIIESLKDLERELLSFNSSLHILYGDPTKEIPQFIKKNKIKHLYFNRDYEPYAKRRDKKVYEELSKSKIKVDACKDSVIFESPEVKTNNGDIYKVFTPYKNKWLDTFKSRKLPKYTPNMESLKKIENPKSILEVNWFSEIGFEESDNLIKGGRSEALKKLKKFKPKISQYKKNRDYPAIPGTSDISTYIRHGCVSIRELVRFSRNNPDEGKDTWLSELVWRDFYQMILDTHPHITKSSFKPEYDKINWSNNKKLFQAWCDGQTGFPIVDSAMRCFNKTGMMHNRLRMVVASFLCKLLHIDWRWGEEYFAEYLMDFDLAANNGGWQWSSSSGCDSQPYFRIFNPYSQSEKFDKDGEFIKKYCPELKGFKKKLIHQPDKADLSEQMEAGCVLGKDYPFPIIDYKEAREFTLNELYAVVKKT